MRVWKVMNYLSQVHNMTNNNKPIEAFLYWSPQSSFRMYDKKIILSVDNSSGKIQIFKWLKTTLTIQYRVINIIPHKANNCHFIFVAFSFALQKFENVHINPERCQKTTSYCVHIPLLCITWWIWMEVQVNRCSQCNVLV